MFLKLNLIDEGMKKSRHNSFQMSHGKPLGLGIQLLTCLKGLFQIKMNTTTWRKVLFRTSQICIINIPAFPQFPPVSRLLAYSVHWMLPFWTLTSLSYKQKPVFKNSSHFLIKKMRTASFQIKRRYWNKNHKIQNKNSKAINFSQTQRQWGVSQKKFLHQTSQRRNLPSYLI